MQTHLRDGAVLLHQQGGVVVDGLGLWLVPAQATQQAGEEASASGLLSRGAGRGACSGGAERDYNRAGQLFDRSGHNRVPTLAREGTGADGWSVLGTHLRGNNI